MTQQDISALCEVGVAIGAMLAFVLVYFLPWIMAARRKTKNRAWVAIINTFLGWSIIFWFVALALATSGEREAHA